MAVYGLRVKHPTTGVVLLEITDRITRILGSLSTGTTSGSYTVSTSLGTAFFVCAVSSNFSATQTTPSIVVSGNTVTWTFNNVAGYTPTPVYIQYGVY